MQGLEGFKVAMGEELFAGFSEAQILGLVEAFDGLHANLKTMQAADAAAAKFKKSGT